VRNALADNIYSDLRRLLNEAIVDEDDERKHWDDYDYCGDLSRIMHLSK
jgi:hypothetical protein